MRTMNPSMGFAQVSYRYYEAPHAQSTAKSVCETQPSRAPLLPSDDEWPHLINLLIQMLKVLKALDRLEKQRGWDRPNAQSHYTSAQDYDYKYRIALAFIQAEGVLPVTTVTHTTTTTPEPTDDPNPFTISSAGSLENLHNGDISGKISLSDLANKPHLYAMGGMADNDGEITVMNGDFYTSRHKDGMINTSMTPDGEANVLLWAQVPNWRKPVPLRVDSPNRSSLEQRIESLAQQAGIDTSKPFPFKLTGNFSKLQYHVTGKPTPTETSKTEPTASSYSVSASVAHSTDSSDTHSHHSDATVMVTSTPSTDTHASGADHHAGAASITLENEEAEIIGFFAPNKAGEWTSEGQSTHMHLIDSWGNTGHIEDLIASGEIQVSFPDA